MQVSGVRTTYSPILMCTKRRYERSDNRRRCRENNGRKSLGTDKVQSQESNAGFEVHLPPVMFLRQRQRWTRKKRRSNCQFLRFLLTLLGPRKRWNTIVSAGALRADQTRKKGKEFNKSEGNRHRLHGSSQTVPQVCSCSPTVTHNPAGELA